jgi:hypothetical protein
MHWDQRNLKLAMLQLVRITLSYLIKTKDFFFEIVKVGGMRVGASRPRQTSQGDDKNKNISSEETTEDNATASGKDGQTGNNNQNSEESADDG